MHQQYGDDVLLPVQSKSQSQSRLYQPKHVEDRPEPVPAVQASTAAPKSMTSVPASPSRPKLMKAGVNSDNKVVMQVDCLFLLNLLAMQDCVSCKVWPQAY